MIKTVTMDFEQLKHDILFEPELLTQLAEREGSALKITYKNQYIYFVADIDFFKHIFFDNPKNYVKTPEAIGNLNKVFGDHGLATATDYVMWRKDRTALNSLFTQDKMKQYLNDMVKTTTETLEQWNKYVETGKPLNISHEIAHLTMRNVSNTLFKGIVVDGMDEIPPLGRDLLLSNLYFSKQTILDLLPQSTYQRKLKRFNKIVDDMVKHSFDANVPEDNLIKYLANVYGYNSFDKLDSEMHTHLHSEAVTFLIGGHETIAAVLGFVIAYLSLYPNETKLIQDEVKTVIGSRPPTFEDLPKLVHTSAFIKETLRLHPSIRGVLRVAVKEDKIQDVEVKPNDAFIIHIVSVHRLSKYWQNPEAFQPSRFVQPMSETQRRAFVPFALGERNCIGSQFALTEATMLLAMLAQRFNIYLSSGTVMKPEIAMLNHLNKDVTVRLEKV